MLSNLPRLSYFKTINDHHDKTSMIRSLKNEYFKEYTECDFLHAFLLSECMDRQKESDLPANMLLLYMIPQSDVEVLYRSYVQNGLVDENGRFTILASEYNIYCLFQKR